LSLNVALTARDADVIKTYVRIGLGVGIVADVAWDPARDRGLVALESEHRFPVQTTWIAFARDWLLRSYMYDLLALVATHLTRECVEARPAALIRKRPTPYSKGCRCSGELTDRP
jgi:DNA-binding transcriptional LysR family regulator